MILERDWKQQKTHKKNPTKKKQEHFKKEE